MDQLATVFESASVDNANQNSQLLQQLADERAKVEDLTERLRTRTEAGTLQYKSSDLIRATLITSRPSDFLRCDQCRAKRSSRRRSVQDFQDQVYTTVFGNHNGYVGIRQLLNDIRCVVDTNFDTNFP